MSASRLPDAAAAGREALALFRTLSSEDPDAYKADLRMGLENLSTYLEQVGETEEAGKLRKEAEGIEIDGFSEDEDEDWEDDESDEDEHHHHHHHDHHHHPH